MAKEFKDFTFMGKKLSDLSVKYVSVDFDGDADVNMAMERIWKRVIPIDIK